MGDSKRFVTRSKMVPLRATLAGSSCNDGSKAYNFDDFDFRWEIYDISISHTSSSLKNGLNTSDQNVSQSSLLIQTKNPLRVQVPPGHLVSGHSYSVKFYVFARSKADIATITNNSVEVLLVVQTQTLVALLKGGDRFASADYPLVLDASASFDPDDTGDTAVFDWECVDVTDQNIHGPCRDMSVNASFRSESILQLPSSSMINISKGQLQPNRTLQLTILYKKGARTANASQLIYVRGGEIPVVDISPLKNIQYNSRGNPKINPSKKIRIIANVKTQYPGSLQLQWSEVSGKLSNDVLARTKLDLPNCFDRTSFESFPDTSDHCN
jgi:hypothetical protein